MPNKSGELAILSFTQVVGPEMPLKGLFTKYGVDGLQNPHIKVRYLLGIHTLLRGTSEG